VSATDEPWPTAEEARAAAGAARPFTIQEYDPGPAALRRAARWGSLDDLVDEDGGWYPDRDELFDRDHPDRPDNARADRDDR
jgi:hypothetical protein